ncbi:MAG TPA: 2,3-bisphosphoglycerate-independent phosphoglycerate mutase, partial [Rhodospirillaceae bacterium]|nr:2,3-bisphosphoglycerate-independent phosphoglycerate mutase [Rhodospirillaceae bacterium]
HVTYFFNVGNEQQFEGEDRILVPSPRVPTYDVQPEMAAPKVTQRLVKAIEGGEYGFIVVNFANPDMVGHTGSMSAAVKAVETIDVCLGQLVSALDKAGGAMLVTADHGNIELMRDPETGQPHTSHTCNPVPGVLVGGPADVTSLRHGCLADIAPTLLALMGLDHPKEMTGQSLLVMASEHVRAKAASA